MFTNSIRWRIQLWHGSLLVVVVSAMLFTFYHYEGNRRAQQIDATLHMLLTPLLPTISHPGRPGGGRGPEGRDDDRGPRSDDDPDRPVSAQNDSTRNFTRNPDYYFAGWSNGRLVAHSENAPEIPVPNNDDFKPEHPIRVRGLYREIIQRVPGETYVIVGVPTATLATSMQQLAFKLVLLGMGIIGVSFVGGWWLVGRALRPIAEISAAAEKISEGDLNKRVKVEDTETELGQLAGVLNRTFDKLDSIFQQQIRFTADASHELRTPLTVILTQVQLALSRERTPEEYRKTLDTCERAAERMRILVNDLMELARMDAGELTVLRERCDLSRIAHDALDLIQPLARKRHVTVHQALEPIQMQADVMKLGQVLINLLNNAIQHNQEGIELRLTVERNGRSAIIKVSDNGSGIPKESLPHLFDRFYRVDKSRARGKGNSGLGLAISKSIIESHGGAIHVESDSGKGATFTIELPLEAEATQWYSKKI